MRPLFIASFIAVVVFTANAATVTVTAPNGGESLTWGGINCTWTSSGLAPEDLMEVSLSLDSGATWTVVESSTPNDGSTWFTAPSGVVYTQCKVRVRAIATGVVDESDAEFSLVAPPASIFVMWPSTGTVGAVSIINWTSTGIVGNVNIDLSIDGQLTWTSIAVNSPNDGSESFNLPNTPSTSCYIRVQEVDGDPSDVSDFSFSILPEFGIITITTPVGGTFQSGQPMLVAWITSNSTLSFVNIDFSYDAGANWTTAAFSTANDGVEMVTPVAPFGSSALVRVRDIDGSPSGISMPFTVVNSGINTPGMLGAIAMTSTHVQLNWMDNSSNEVSFEIQRSTEPMFMFWWPLNAPANQSFFSDFGVLPNTQYYYRIRAVGPSSGMPPMQEMSGFSNVAIVTTPPGASGPAAPTGLSGFAASATQVNLFWMDNSFNETGFEIQRSIEPMFMIPTPYFAAMNSPFFSDFSVQPNTTYYYRVRASGMAPSSYSNVATVTTPPLPPPSLAIQFPYDGAFVSAGSFGYVNIQTQYASGPLVAEFSQDSGETWSVLANFTIPFVTTNGNSYSIPVTYPVVVANTCRVRVTDVPSGVAAETGDFRLVIPFEITQPKGGEVFYIGQSQTFEVRDIDWYLTSVSLELSRDGGATWAALGTVSGEERQYSGNIPFTWTVSGPASKACKVRVTADLDGTPLTLEGQLFTISELVSAGGGAPTGPAGGDLTGIYPDPAIAAQAVTTLKIADGAVTPGPVPPFGVGGKISSAGMSPDRVLASDGAGGTLWKHLDDVVFGSTGLTAAQQFVSKQGDTLTGALTAPEVHVSQNGLQVGTSQLVTVGGKVGIGTNVPTSKLTVSGVIETDNGVKYGSAGKQTAAVKGGIVPVTAVAKNHVETITDANVKVGSVIVVTLLDGDSATTNNKDAVLTLRQVNNGSFKVSLSSATNFSTSADLIHYIILVSPD